MERDDVSGGPRGGAVWAISPRLIRLEAIFFANFQQNISLIRLFPAYKEFNVSSAMP